MQSNISRRVTVRRLLADSSLNTHSPIASCVMDTSSTLQYTCRSRLAAYPSPEIPWRQSRAQLLPARTAGRGQRRICQATPVLSTSSASHVARFFGRSLATAASSVPTGASNVRLSSFDKDAAGLHSLNQVWRNDECAWSHFAACAVLSYKGSYAGQYAQ